MLAKISTLVSNDFSYFIVMTYSSYVISGFISSYCLAYFALCRIASQEFQNFLKCYCVSRFSEFTMCLSMAWNFQNMRLTVHSHRKTQDLLSFRVGSQSTFGDKAKSREGVPIQVLANSLESLGRKGGHGT